MPRLVLARHGRTEWNALGKLQGCTDIPLDETGRDQARALGAALTGEGIGAVWSSDLLRAKETASIVATVLELGEPHIDPELRERKFGVFEGLTRSECATRHPEAWRAWLARTVAPPDGEQVADAVARIHRVLHRLATTDGKPVLVVSHGGVMRLWLMNVLGSTIPLLGNGAMYHVEHDGSRFSALAR
ncbi:MAG: histidine phosphatase family protein [Kofleriaceae bacterium]